MRLRLSSRGVVLSAIQREQIERMVRLALGRHAPRLGSAVVHLLPSPRILGAGHVCCRIRLRQRDGRVSIAEEHAPDVQGAAFGACARMERRLDLERTLPRSARPHRVPTR